MTKELYHEKYYRRSKKFQCDLPRNKQFLKQILKYNPRRVLDVGCGWGVLVQLCRRRDIESYGIDFAPILKEKFWDNSPYLIEADAKNIPFSDKFFDLVVSSDFFEHLPLEDIDTVFQEMKRVAYKVMARIPAPSVLTESQRLYHIINESKEWWENRLKGAIILGYD